MKKPLLFLITANIFLLFSCKQEAPDSHPSTAVIEGTIVNPKSNLIILENPEGENSKDTIKLDTATGNFRAVVKANKANYYDFYHGNEYALLYIRPDDSISLTLNTDEFDETLTFSGKGAGANNYFIQKLLLEEKEEKSFHEQYYEMEPGHFLKYRDTLLQLYMNFYKDFAQAHSDLDEAFMENEMADIIYNNAESKLIFPSYYSYRTNGKKVEDTLSNYYDFLDQVIVEDTSLMNNETYTDFLSVYHNRIARKVYYKDSLKYQNNENGYLSALLDAALTGYSEEKIKNYLLYSKLNNWISNHGADGLESYLKMFKNACTNKEYIAKVEENYTKWSRLAKGKIAPEFTYHDIDSNIISLNDLKGKLVYIDVWATWCGPCRAELPHLEKLQEEFKNENIAFVSVSIDEDKKAWHNMVTEKEMKGVQLIADKNWESSICKDYIIDGIPRFILIDEQGKILNADAERPSGQIKEELKKHLEI